MNTSRRTFLINFAATGTGLCATPTMAQTELDQKDPQAVALSYAADSSKVDAKKFPKHDNTQLCNGCALWLSRPTDLKGNCPLFAGRQVSAKGWCSAWAKRT